MSSTGVRAGRQWGNFSDEVGSQELDGQWLRCDAVSSLDALAGVNANARLEDSSITGGQLTASERARGHRCGLSRTDDRGGRTNAGGDLVQQETCLGPRGRASRLVKRRTRLEVEDGKEARVGPSDEMSLVVESVEASTHRRTAALLPSERTRSSGSRIHRCNSKQVSRGFKVVPAHCSACGMHIPVTVRRNSLPGSPLLQHGRPS